MPRVKRDTEEKVRAQVQQLREGGTSWREVAKVTGRSVNYCRTLAAQGAAPTPEPDTPAPETDTPKGATLIMPGNDPKTPKKTKKQEAPPADEDEQGDADEQHDDEQEAVRYLVF